MRTVDTHALPTPLELDRFPSPRLAIVWLPQGAPLPQEIYSFFPPVFLSWTTAALALHVGNALFIYVLTKWLVALLAHLKLPKLCQGDGLCFHVLVCNQSPGEDWGGRASLCSLTIQHASRGSVALCWHQEMPADRVENLRCSHWQLPMLLLISPSAPLLMSTPIYE